MKYVLLVSSHNTRIQCELNKIASTFGKTRFKNGAIIRVSLSSSEVTIKIVDSGELADSELHKISEDRPYYVSDCEAPEVFDKRERYIKPTKVTKKNSIWSWFKPKTKRISEANENEEKYLEKTKFDSASMPGPIHKKQNVVRYPYHSFIGNVAKSILQKLGVNPGNNEYVFYIIRHGQAMHNATNSHLTLDTELTGEGSTQAYEAGKRLVQILADYKEYPTTLCVSDLRRTHQTMDRIIKGMDTVIYKELRAYKERQSQSDLQVAPKEVQSNCSLRKHWVEDKDKRNNLHSMIDSLYYMTFYVLPCSSELSVLDGEGNCDEKNANARFTKKLGRENYPSGKREPFMNENPINWKYYLDFYKGNRDESLFTPPKEQKQCRDTSMLKEAVHIHLNKNNVYSEEGLRVTGEDTFGGTRRRNRKRRTKRT
jgi:hypothetical protein